MKHLLKISCCALLLSLTTLIHSHTTTRITNKIFEDTELYPVTDPYQEGYLQVSPIHKLYYAQFGNPHGMPVLILHGGPGAGCDKSLSAFFDLSYYRVIMVDQRGAMRSQPFAEMQDNRSDYLVEDMELVRKHLGIDKWLLFGGSWGSALAVLYGEAYPEQILGFVLRGVCLVRKKDYEHLFYGMKQFFPEIWQSMVEPFSADEQADLITTFYNQIMDPNPSIHMPVAHAFMHYDTIAGTCRANPDLVGQFDDKSVLSIARAFIYYSFHHFFVTDNQLLDNLTKISHLPAIIVQGRYDMICPPQTAYDLHVEWNNSQLWFIPEGGHFASDPFISRGLKEALDVMKSII